LYGGYRDIWKSDEGRGGEIVTEARRQRRGRRDMEGKAGIQKLKQIP
jgi:hypothetical protein